MERIAGVICPFFFKFALLASGLFNVLVDAYPHFLLGFWSNLL